MMRRWMLVLLIAGGLLLPAVATAGGCSLVVNRNGVSVTVSRGPCSVSDFPVWCDAYVPQVIEQGQTIRCEYVVLIATPTPRPVVRPAVVATPTAVPLLERLKRGSIFRGFR